MLVEGRCVGVEPALVLEAALDEVESDLRQAPLRHLVQVFDIDRVFDPHWAGLSLNGAKPGADIDFDLPGKPLTPTLSPPAGRGLDPPRSGGRVRGEHSRTTRYSLLTRLARGDEQEGSGEANLAVRRGIGREGCLGFLDDRLARRLVGLFLVEE